MNVNLGVPSNDVCTICGKAAKRINGIPMHYRYRHNLTHEAQMTSSELREQLADLCHEQWAGWMIYLFDKCKPVGDGSFIIPKEWVDRWAKQTMTLYSKLSEDEQESDRKEADKFLAALGFSEER